MSDPIVQNVRGQEDIIETVKKDGTKVSETDVGRTIVPGVPTSGFEMSEDPLNELRSRLLKWDPNHMDKRESTYMDKISYDDEIKTELSPEEDSPYAEVRVAVHNYDIDVPCNTIRAWTIGLLMVCIGSSVNTLFSLRNPSIGLGTLLAQLIAWPVSTKFIWSSDGLS